MAAFLKSVAPERVVAHGLNILAIILAALVLHLLIRAGLRRTARRVGLARALPPAEAKRISTLLGLVSNGAGYVIFLLAFLIALREAGVNTAPLMGGAAILGLAFSFGAQNLVRDIVSGFFILFEGQYNIGDRVELNSVMGVVEDVGLRVTKLRDANGVIHWFPNGLITAINTYPAAGLPFILRLSADEQASATVEQALAEFDAQFAAFAARAEKRDTIPTSLGTMLTFLLHLRPEQVATAQERLAQYLRAALTRAGRGEPADIYLIARR
jgi:hypothetical protein